jgi:hypothetical protein
MKAGPALVSIGRRFSHMEKRVRDSGGKNPIGSGIFPMNIGELCSASLSVLTDDRTQELR